MKLKPSRAFILCLIPLLATGVAGTWAWQKANSVPMHIRAKSSFFELLRYQDKARPQFEMPTPAQIAETRQVTLDLMAQLTTEFPTLDITEHSVPDDQNGFRLLHLLAGTEGLPMDSEFLDVVTRCTPWDPAIVERGLTEYADLVSQIEHIASLQTRSSANMPDDYVGFVFARNAKYSSDVLLGKARLAAESHNEQEALRCVRAAQNIASHYREVETSSLLSETVTLLIDLSTNATAFEHLLPALGPDADLPAWKSALSPRAYTSAEFAKVMRGEWHISTEFMLLPVILSEQYPENPSDPEALARAIASRFNDRILHLSEVSLDQLVEDGLLPKTGTPPKLSKRSRKLLETFEIGADAWAKGYCRGASMLAEHQAGLDLLILEKSGTTPAAETTAFITPDPISNSAFVFDPASRILSPPATSKVEADPIQLPW